MAVSDLPATGPVWLDSRNIGVNNGTGVTRYAQDLATCLGDIDIRTVFVNSHMPAPKGLSFGKFDRAGRLIRSLWPWRYVACGRDADGHETALCPDLYRRAHVRYKTFGRLTLVDTLVPPAVMHWTYPLPMVMLGCINVVTVHDLVPILNPGLTGIDPIRFSRLLRALFMRVDVIVTVSETVRQQIIDIMNVSSRRVVNLYQMVDIDIPAVMESTRIIPPGSLIHIGRVESRKNIEHLIAAYGRSGSTRPLVLVGPDGDDRPDLSLPPGPGQLIRVPWSERLSLLRGLAEAHALVFPSLAEGFGLPIVEAMLLGTPVLTSRGGATEEIAGGAALLVDPYDVGDIARAIRDLDQCDKHEGLCRDLVERGHVRTALFSRAAYAARLKAFYASLPACGRAI